MTAADVEISWREFEISVGHSLPGQHENSSSKHSQNLHDARVMFTDY